MSIAGILVGLGEAHQAKQKTLFEREMARRDTLAKAAFDIYQSPNTRPEAKEQALKHALGIMMQDPGKKLPKELEDLTPLLTVPALPQMKEAGTPAGPSMPMGVSPAQTFTSGSPPPEQLGPQEFPGPQSSFSLPEQLGPTLPGAPAVSLPPPPPPPALPSQYTPEELRDMAAPQIDSVDLGDKVALMDKRSGKVLATLPKGLPSASVTVPGIGKVEGPTAVLGPVISATATAQRQKEEQEFRKAQAEDEREFRRQEAISNKAFQERMERLRSESREKAAGIRANTRQVTGETARMTSAAESLDDAAEQLKQAIKTRGKEAIFGMVSGTDRELSHLLDTLIDNQTYISTGAAASKEQMALYRRMFGGWGDVFMTGGEKAAIDSIEKTQARAKKVLSMMARPGGGNGQNEAQPAPIIQRNKKTGAYRYSLDGGRTWQKGQPSK
jgi:hypothetical protein